mgnify:CR=1 FL=1
MAGLGRRYHPFTAKATLILFGLLLISGFGSSYLPIPFISMLALPAVIIHGIIIGAAGVSLPSIAQTASLVVVYYLVAVVLGYIVHSFVGNRGSTI